MKSILLSVGIFFSLLCAAQNKEVSKLLPGKYETFNREKQSKWDRGDIMLIDENTYKISTNKEVGEYKFSVTAQRIFFISGPLKNVYAKTFLNNNAPVIILPVSENEQHGLKLSTEIWCYYKH